MFRREIIRSQIFAATLYWLLIPAALISSGLALDRLFGLSALVDISMVLPGLLICLGFILIFLATRELANVGGGTPNPRRPPRSLVTGGAYRLCRHPMFLGYDLAAFGVTLLVSSPGMLFVSYPVFVILQIRFLRKEELILASKFRSTYGDYRRKTSFLIPFL